MLVTPLSVLRTLNRRQRGDKSRKRLDLNLILKLTRVVLRVYKSNKVSEKRSRLTGMMQLTQPSLVVSANVAA